MRIIPGVGVCMGLQSRQALYPGQFRAYSIPSFSGAFPGYVQLRAVFF